MSTTSYICSHVIRTADEITPQVLEDILKPKQYNKAQLIIE